MPLFKQICFAIAVLSGVLFAGEKTEISPVKSRADGLSPQDAVKAMKVPDGFRVKLVASEPDIHQPVAFCFDERGRMWLLESYDYPMGPKVGQKGKDRILILEDTTGSGKADKIKVFYEGLNLATGIEVGYGGVFVGAAPDLLFISDKNRDDVPDGSPEVLLTGFGRQDTHELLNSFIWGPDGWLYGNHGVFTYSNVQNIKFSAAVWRYHPTSKKFEIFAEGGSNQWGLDFDDYGSAFITACVIPHLFHMVPGGLYQRQGGQNANPYAYGEITTIADHRHFTGNQWNNNDRSSSDALGGGHAHDGACIYLGDTFPPEYRNTILMGNIHGNRINRDILERYKSGYVGKHGPDFLLSNDKWFIPTGVRQGPDGSVFVSDWYDKQHCHDKNTERWDRTNGRLYKVEYKDTKWPGAFDLSKLSTAELCEMQKSRNDWKVRQSRRILAERKPAEAIPLLKEIALKGETQEICLRGLWALYCVGGFEESLAQEVLKSKHSWMRVWAVRFAGENGATPEVLKTFPEFARSEPAPEVRSQLLSTCQRIKASDDIVLQILFNLSSREGDEFDPNIPLLTWVAYEQRMMKDVNGAAKDLKLLSQFTSGVFEHYVASRAMRRWMATQDPKLMALAFEIFGSASTEGAAGILLDGIELGLKGRGKVTAPENWAEVYAAAQKRNGPGTLKRLNLIAAQFGDVKSLSKALELAGDRGTPDSERADAIRMLASSKAIGAETVCFDIIDGKSSDALTREAIRALGSFSSIENAKGIILRWKTFNLVARVETLDVLCSRPDYAAALLDAVAAKTIPHGDIGMAAVQRMRKLNDAALNQKIESAWGRVRDRAPDEIKAQIEKMRGVIGGGPGEAKNGAKIFEKTCMPCHAIFGKGNHVGPELTGSNRKDLNYLLENIVDPNAVVGAPYYVWSVKTNDGVVTSGIMAEKDDKSVTLKSENDKLTVIQRADIAKLVESPKSMMPEGMSEALKPEEFRDLVKFLQGDGW